MFLLSHLKKKKKNEWSQEKITLRKLRERKINISKVRGSQKRLVSTIQTFDRLMVACQLSTELPGSQCKEKNKKLQDNLVWSAEEERNVILQKCGEDILEITSDVNPKCTQKLCTWMKHRSLIWAVITSSKSWRLGEV